MKINLGMLNNRDRLEIDEIVTYDEEYLKDSLINKLSDVHVSGYFSQTDLDEYKCNLEVTGQMFLLDSVTNEEKPLDFNFVINDIIEENLINEQNMLDIMELLWQNIVLEVPIRFTDSDADNLKGENWKVIDEDDEEEKIDPRMEKLYDYYKGGE